MRSANLRDTPTTSIFPPFPEAACIIWAGIMEPVKSSPKSGNEAEPAGKQIQGFPERLLSAEHMLASGAKQSVLPNFGGEKGFQPNPKYSKKTEEYYDELYRILGEERVCRRGDLSTGRWDPGRELIVVESPVGSFWKKFGTKRDGLFHALPEEGLFLMEQGVFELFWNELPLSLEDSWMLLLTSLPSLDYYTVFAFLCRQGFAVVSSEKHRRFPHRQSICPGTTSSQDLLLEARKEDTSAPMSLNVLSNSNSSGEYDNRIFHEMSRKKCKLITKNSEIETSCDGASDSFEFGIDAERENDNMPLVLPQDAVSMEAVLKRLQIIKPRLTGRSILPSEKDSSKKKLDLSTACKTGIKPSDSRSETSISAVTVSSSSTVAMAEMATGFPDLSRYPDRTREFKLKPSTSPSPPADNLTRNADVIRSQVEVSSSSSSLASVASRNLGTSSVESLDPDMTSSFPAVVEKRPTITGNLLDLNAIQTEKQVQTSNLGEWRGIPTADITLPTSSHEVKSSFDKMPYFDVYYNTATFKKSIPGLPDCRIYPCSYQESPVDQSTLEGVFDNGSNVPIKFGVCDQGSVTFYSMIPVNVSVTL